MIRFDGPHVPIDFAQAVLKKILDERLVVTRIQTGNPYAPLVRVMLDRRTGGLDFPTSGVDPHDVQIRHGDQYTGAV